MTSYTPRATLDPDALPAVYEGLLRRGAWRDVRSLWSEWRDHTPVPFELVCVGWKTNYAITLETKEAHGAVLRLEQSDGGRVDTYTIPFDKVTVKWDGNNVTHYRATISFAQLGDGIFRCYLELPDGHMRSRAVKLLSVTASDAYGAEGCNGFSTEKAQVNGKPVIKDLMHEVSHICLRSFGFVEAESMTGVFACFNIHSPHGMGVPLIFPKNVYDLSRIFYHQQPRFNQPARTWTFAIDDDKREVKFAKWQEPIIPGLFNTLGKFLSPIEAGAREVVGVPADSPMAKYHILTPAFTCNDPYVWAVILHHAIRMSQSDLLLALLAPPLARPLCMNQNAFLWLDVNKDKLKEVHKSLCGLPPLPTYSDQTFEFLRAREFHRQQEKAENEKKPAKEIQAQAAAKKVSAAGKRGPGEAGMLPAKRAKIGK